MSQVRCEHGAVAVVVVVRAVASRVEPSGAAGRARSRMPEVGGHARLAKKMADPKDPPVTNLKRGI